MPGALTGKKLILIFKICRAQICFIFDRFIKTVFMIHKLSFVCRSSEMASTRCGTKVYMAPEILDAKPYNHKADLWSLGCIFYELVTVTLAFNDESEFTLFDKIRNGTFAPIPLHCLTTHPVVVQFVPRLLSVNPLNRMCTDNILER